MHESIKIIQQALLHLPSGATKIDNNKFMSTS